MINIEHLVSDGQFIVNVISHKFLVPIRGGITLGWPPASKGCSSEVGDLAAR